MASSSFDSHFIPPFAIDSLQHHYDENLGGLPDIPEESIAPPTQLAFKASSTRLDIRVRTSSGSSTRTQASRRPSQHATSDKKTTTIPKCTIGNDAGPSERSREHVHGSSTRSHQAQAVLKGNKSIPASFTSMYWSRAPVHGALPTRRMRSHSVTIVDDTAWVFGGWDDKNCWNDVYCFDTQTMHWSHPEIVGEGPPPCRGHTTTLFRRQLLVFGGGHGSFSSNDVYFLDTKMHHWTRANCTDVLPNKRRAHTAVLYQERLWVFGGGNSLVTLNDVWTLDADVEKAKVKWELIETSGTKPSPRGHHTANVVGNIMIIIGGTDGIQCFNDVWCLNLDTLVWKLVNLPVVYRRFSHSSTQVGLYLFINGGHDGHAYTSETLFLNLVTLQYETRPVLGKPPSPRGYHASFLADSRVFIFGGFGGHTVFNDVHILDLAMAAYLPQVTNFDIAF